MKTAMDLVAAAKAQVTEISVAEAEAALPDEELPLRVFVSAQRHGLYTRVLHVPPQPTVWQLLAAVCEFYTHAMTAEEVEEVRSYVANDCFNYRGKLLAAATAGVAVRWASLMGDAVIYSGFECMAPGDYELLLSS